MSEDFRAQALCAQTDPEIFFSAAGDGTQIGKLERAEAKAICTRCPVVSECLTWALDSGMNYGVWGGKTEDERRALLKKRAELAKPFPVAELGPVAHAIDVHINGNTIEVTTLHALSCGHTKRITADRKRPVLADELSKAWETAIAGRDGPRFCRACKPWNQVSGLHEAEELYRPTPSTPEVCARCGHRTGGCPRCGERHSSLGARIQGVPYCNMSPREPSCYLLQLGTDTLNRAMAS